MLGSFHNPDILTCLANLSSDEVFTPPNVSNQMLDTLPKELWSDKTVTFLDPVSKSGVFLREITKRLIKGLENEFPDIQKRIEHILKNQVFGLGITKLTTELSRRTLYCSKKANGEYSIVNFSDEEGNVKYIDSQHFWADGINCKYCGVNKELYTRNEGLESYAYSFIHEDKSVELFNMKFDVIVGNPPYQLKDGGNNSSATPIYNLFVEKAKKLGPRYISMIIPARWYAGGRGLGAFRDNMLSDGHLREIHDFKDATDCFPGIRVGGGICYFLWDKQYQKDTLLVVEHSKDKIVNSKKRKTIENYSKIFIRDSIVHGILEKVEKKGERKLSKIVFSQKPFGLRTNFTEFDDGGEVKVYNKKSKNGYDFLAREKVPKNLEYIDYWKVVTSRSTSVPEEDNGQVLRLSQTFIAEPGSIVTESYVVVGAFKNEIEAKNLLSYLKTKFFRILCQVNIVSPDVSQRTFDLVPLFDLKKASNDQFLYEKYKLNYEEKQHIERLIKDSSLL